jgi:hypothetical protein
MIRKIYLRSIVHDQKKHLAMFDSNGNGDIDKLVTDAKAGDTIYWKLDRCSRIKSITRIYSKSDEPRIFKSEPRKQLLCKGFKLQIPEDASVGLKVDLLEKYYIEYVPTVGDKIDIDPFIKIPPPPTRPA